MKTYENTSNEMNYWDKVSKRQKTLIEPQFNEDKKKKIFDAIKEIGIKDSKEYLIDVVFNPKSDLYGDETDDYGAVVYTSDYNVENILSAINEEDYKFDTSSLYFELLERLDSIILHEARRLNPDGWDTDVDWESKEIYSDSFFVDACGDFCANAMDWLDKIDINELKEFILSIAKD